MSRFSIPVHRQTHRTLIGEYKSGHRLHLSVVSQHMRRKSIKRLKLRLTPIIEATPPLWHSFLRHFHWSAHFLPQVPRRHLRRQRLEAQHRNINCDKISCQPKHLGSHLGEKASFTHELPRRRQATMAAFYSVGQLWYESRVSWRLKRCLFISRVVNTALSGIEAFCPQRHEGVSMDESAH